MSGFAAPPDWDEVDAMEPVEFEIWVLRHLHGRRIPGWQVLSTPTTGDGGADIVVKHHGQILMLVQCKHTQSPQKGINEAAVQELRRARKAYNAPDAMLVAATNACAWTPQAQSIAQSLGVTLICRTNWQRAWDDLLSGMAP